MVMIVGERRENARGAPGGWVNLGDVIAWLDTLPAEPHNRIAAAVATEIRQMLYRSIENAQIITRE